MVKEIENRIIEANNAYRTGNAIMSDREYDSLLEELSKLDPDNALLSTIGIEITDETRKRKLDIPMASMNKIKTMDDIKDWIRLKSIPKDTLIVITPKYDGLSLCVDEFKNTATTRGDGVFGHASDEHYKLIKNHLYEENVNDSDKEFLYTYGEVIMPKAIFEDKYSEDFANPRNLVAGLLNSKDVSDSLSDCLYVKYGAIPNPNARFKFGAKSEILDHLNEGQKVKVNFKLIPLQHITEDMLLSLFKEWSSDFEIDGLILEVNDLHLQEKLGRETSTNNPVWARAFKHDSFEQRAETEVIGISWNISKQGLLKPILHVNPIRLDGVTVSNVTGNNARFVKDMGLGVGAKVVIKRSGMVIPLIVDVLETVEFTMPKIEGIEIDWNENGIELVTLTETDEQKLKKNIAFFEILEADNVGEGVITQLWEAGYETIEDILSLSKADLEKIDRFGKRKSQIVFDSIKKSVNGVELSKLQHATGIFTGLGSKKLALLEGFKTKPTINQVMEIEGFAEISAKTYVDNYDKFYEFIKDLPVTITEKKETEKVSTDLDNEVFVFTGVRRKDLEEVIQSKGGTIGGSVSKNTTYLVMKAKGSGSSKEVKAESLGVKIITVDELEEILK